MNPANLHICFVFAPQDELHPAAATHVPGSAWTLHIHRAPTGSFYPHVAEAANPHDYRFFAGRVPSAPLINGFPAGHFVSAPEAARPAPDMNSDGSWLAVRFDRRRDVLTVAADAMNGQQWFYGGDGRTWYVANSLRYLYTLLPETPHIERRAVAALLRYGFVPGPLTPLRSVCKLEAGDVLTITRERFTVAPRPVASFPAATADALTSRLLEAVARETDGLNSIVLPLSGGLVSRALLGAALAVFPREAITTLAYGHPRSWDFRLGAALAQKFGVRHLALEPDFRPLAEILNDNFVTQEGCGDIVSNVPLLSFTDAMPDGTYVLSGICGCQAPPTAPPELSLIADEDYPERPGGDGAPPVFPARRKAFYLTPLLASALRHHRSDLPAVLKAAFPELYAFPTTRNHGASLIAPAGAVRWRRAIARLGDHRERDRVELAAHRDYIFGVFDGLRSLPALVPEGLRTLRQRFERRQFVSTPVMHALLTLGQWQAQFPQQRPASG